MSKGKEQEPTREEMLGYIENARTEKGIRITHIRGYGPGTGLDPDISQLPDESLKAIYNGVRFVEEEQQKSQGSLSEPSQ